MSDRATMESIARLVPQGSRVLDLGCGDGALLDHLQRERGCSGYGIEIADDNVLACTKRGVNVIQLNLDEGLSIFDDDTFDVVLQIDTLQHLRNAETMLRETARVGKLGIVAFPNFAHWPNRLSILRGRMPVTKRCRYQWYDTPNIRVGTFKDFEVLATRNRLAILDAFGLQEGREVRTAAQPARGHRGVQVRAGMNARDALYAAGRSPFGEALRFWLKLGFISFGGPAGQIAIMHRELVEQKRWISERRFLHALNYCMLLPGPEAQQLATYIGWLMHRTWGGIAAGALFVLPSLVLLIGLSWVYVVFGNVAWVAGLFYGIKPAVAAIVLQAVWRIGSRTLKSPRGAAAVGDRARQLRRDRLCCRCRSPGSCWLRRRWARRAVGSRRRSSAGRRPRARTEALGPALIDDDTPTPPHARFSKSRLAWWRRRRAAVAAADGAAGGVAGLDGTLAQMGWFFTKAALLTFGGAYAVLPYVYQGAVEQFQWLTGPQMIDGLALGETTPGR
jgi:methionine biosynthesis protein MetW